MNEMQQGKMYYISFSGTELVCRYKETDITQHFFFSHLHYWNGFEKFHIGGWCVKSGISEIREATQAEKYNLFRHEIKDHAV